LDPYRSLADQRNTVVAERARFQTVVDNHFTVVELRGQIADFEGELAALPAAPEEGPDPNAVERDALTTQIADLRSQLEAADVARLQGYSTLVENNDIVVYVPDDFSRLQQTGWGGTLGGFVEGTLIGGRPTSASYWPQPMAAWAQETGGPLRPDQIRNLTAYILNWERDFTIEELRNVRQFAKEPTDVGAVAATGSEIGTDNVTVILNELAALREGGFEADPAAGQALFEGTYACAGCHGAQPGTGPALTDQWTRVVNDEDGRLTQTGFVDNPEGYLVQSIAQPNAYVVPGYAADAVMPQNFTTDRMSYEDLAHILAYLEQQD
ncbi:MAG: cytochrome c, partial [Anaerolineae bacterium]|nr:cytochrome c [Anaerolineae bacterium]